ncbi:MAG: HAMP domain-containing histidine kinase [Bacteroidales bacterium]|nr:HAMP domain-containing histidine kinase [Bacteroidales bacterium]
MRFFQAKYYLLFAVILFVAATIIENKRLHSELYSVDTYSFSKVLHKKEYRVNKIIDLLSKKIELQDTISFKLSEIDDFEKLFQKKGLCFLIYENNYLKFWSNNSIPVNNYFSDSDLDKKIVKLKNGWYVVKSTTVKNRIIVGLILIKKSYFYENEFLKNEFQNDFNIPDKFDISTKNENENFSIYSLDKEFLFSIVSNDITKDISGSLYFTFLLFCISLLSFLLSVYYFLKYENNSKKKYVIIAILTFLFFVLRFFMIRCGFPSSFYSLSVFDPRYFAASAIFPSLGDFFINTILLLFLIILIKINFVIPDNYLKISGIKRSIISFLGFVLIICIFLIVHYLVKSLIYNSSISFEVYNVLELTTYSFIGFLIIALLIFSFVFLSDVIINIIRRIISLQNYFLYLTISIILVFVLVNIISYKFDFFSALFLFLFILFLGYIRYKKELQYSVITLFILLISLYLAYFTSVTTNKKEKDTRKVLAINLASEHDPIAELLLEKIDNKLEDNESLIKFLSKQDFNFEEIYKYLQKNIFIGFWGKYEFQLTICNPYDSVLLEPDNTWQYCYGFFDGLINKNGYKLPNSDFYFFDNQNGRITYFGEFKYKISNKHPEITLFIQLDSKLISEELGYPELLLDKNLYKASNIGKYSYAKYKNNELITQSGQYLYSLNRKVYGCQTIKFAFLTFDNYEHLIYNLDEKTTIILSKPSIRFLDYLISFSYVFVFFFILASIVLLFTNSVTKIMDFELNFKNKIQTAIITVLFLSLLLIGFGTVYYIIKQYKNNHYQNISERIQSVLVELEHKLAYEDDLYKVPDDYLTSLLIKFSNVFYTDINLYDINGNLITTSRDEIFNKGLIGKKMNSEAYFQLANKQKAKYIHNESIGNLKYLSAYVPFVNNENKLLAYLNLPYFSKHSLLKKEVSTIVIAIINIYVLLILLTLFIAVFISNKLTRPLKLISEKFKKIKLGKLNEPIEYESKDEIGSLVKEYNRMVKELSLSVELLAKSERESAWREMAKQIAHEIKNPLTPMKLSVQLLKRTWDDKDPDFEKRIIKVTETLIEQIDSLSAIAAEFSAFAKMPKEIHEEVNVVNKIKNVVTLFEDTQNIQFLVDYNNHKELFVLADREQLLRVFNNLIQNAIQAIPKNKEGKIVIELFKKNHNAIIKISDNGVGIPDLMKEKLFQPNFTTKSSGMGLGLAMVKRIIENINGTIWFETEIGKGTKFFVELPLI